MREKDEVVEVIRERPTPGVQYHDFKQAQPKTEIAQASAVPHYLIPFSWYQKFIAYVQDGNGVCPPDLDLTELDQFMDGGELRSNLKSGREVHILQVEQWTMIQAWYGQEDEQCVRHSYKLKDNSFVIEYKPSQFYFSLYTPPSSFTELERISMYKYKDVEGLYEKVRHAFGISPSHQIRFWHTTESAGLTNLNNAKEAINKTYDRVSIGIVTDGSTSFIVETRKNATEKWQLEGCKKAQIERTRTTGTKGLTNLGNTCYMASALQCLSHVRELSEYFLSGYYKTEINTDNPLGYDGRVARSFARLLSQLYSDDNQRAIAPRELKTVLGNINQSFGGYQQQDSQELLAFLLDALHEDLNRIVKKPLTERPDIGDVDDAELLRLGEEAWRIHKLRNDSVIVDLFQGIYKSTLVCPICSHVSITFDPFSDLSLPLPFRSYWVHDIHYVPLHGSIIKITLEFEQNASIGQIISYLSKRYNVKANHVAGAEVWKHRFYKLYENYMPVTTIEKSDDAYFYELDSVDPRVDKSSKSIWVPVYTNRRTKRQEKAEECGIPYPIILSEEESKAFHVIQSKLIASYSRFTTSADLSSFGDKLTRDSRSQSQESDGVHDQITEETPFLIKVGPHKIGASFYGGSEPVLLHDRMKKRIASVASTKLDQLPADAEGDAAELPPYVSNADIKDDEIGPQDRESPGMQDASDDENPLSNSGLVKDIASPSQSRSESVVDTLPTPQSTPTTPVNDYFMSDQSDETMLIFPKDAIYCEWSEVVYDQLFSDDQSTIGGKSRWDDCELQVDQAMDARRAARDSDKHNTKSLEDCLDEFAKEEPLDAENTWYCPKCKEHQRANKTFELWRSGDVLVFHLKRFSSSRSLSDKIDAEIRFPVRGLDLRERLGERRLKAQRGDTQLEESIYDLTGVVNHYGGLGGGHYTAFAQTFSQEGYQDFHNFNDSSVNPMDAESLVSSSAYLLFYRRRSSTPAGTALRTKIAKYVEKSPISEVQLLPSDDELVQRQPSSRSSQSDESDSSPATSASGDIKPAPYIPFIGPGHQLGGVVGDPYRASPAPSNPFSGGIWGAHGPTRFGTTNSETSEKPEVHFPDIDNDDSVSWSNSEE